MATVTRKFRDDFECWAADRIAKAWFSESEMDEFRGMLRRDLVPGPDLQRQGLTITITGVEVSAAIDDHEQRYCQWADYFAIEAEAIKAHGFREDRR